MISDEEIKRIAVESGFVRTVISPAWIRFARAIYHLGRQHQRESDAALCRDAAEKYMERSKNSNTHTRAIVALACNAAATCLETAIRSNTGELK